MNNWKDTLDTCDSFLFTFGRVGTACFDLHACWQRMLAPVIRLAFGWVRDGGGQVHSQKLLEAGV